MNGYLRLIWDSKRWLLLFAVVAAAVVYLGSASRSDEYESNALGQIVSGSQASGDILSEEQLLSLSNVYNQLASTRTVLDLAHKDPAVEGREDEFDESVDVSPESRVGVLSFSAVTGSPERSAEFANAYAETFGAYLRGLQVEQLKESLEPVQKRIAELESELEGGGGNDAATELELEALQDQIAAQTATPADSMRIVEQAAPSSTPVSPRPKRDAVIAFVVALLLGASVIYLRDLFFDRYGSAQDASRDLGLPLLGEIPKGRREAPLEAFRSLRTAIVFSLEKAVEPGINGSELGSGTVLVTGAESGCGKSFVTANLSRTLASEGRRVVIVDGDLRRPTQHEIFGTALSPGLSDLLSNGTPPDPSGVEVRVGRQAGARAGELRLLPAGYHAEDSVESLSSGKMKQIVLELQRANDMVVFDSPPTLAVVDPVVLSRYADGVVFVVDSRHTRRREARRAIEALRATGAPLLGFAYNRSTTKPSRYDAYRSPDPRHAAGAPWETPV